MKTKTIYTFIGPYGIAFMACSDPPAWQYESDAESIVTKDRESDRWFVSYRRKKDGKFSSWLLCGDEADAMDALLERSLF